MVEVVDDEIRVLRNGVIDAELIFQVLKKKTS